MNDEQGLLKAIREKPDDDVPRLVYADWLDEHGQPQREEFIRLQVELAAMTDHANSRYADLKRRETALLDAHRNGWEDRDLGGLAKILRNPSRLSLLGSAMWISPAEETPAAYSGAIYEKHTNRDVVTFRRGFAEDILLPYPVDIDPNGQVASDYALTITGHLRDTPVNCIRFCTGISLMDGHGQRQSIGIHPRLFQVLSQQPIANRIKKFGIWRVRDAEAIAQNPNWFPKLTVLESGYCNNENFIRYFSSCLPKLHLHIGDGSSNPHAAQALAEHNAGVPEERKAQARRLLSNNQPLPVAQEAKIVQEAQLAEAAPVPAWRRALRRATGGWLGDDRSYGDHDSGPADNGISRA